MSNNRTQRLVFTSLLAALTCVTTMAVTIPTPLGGYVNLGDAIVLLSATLLSPLYAVFAAGVGSALADLFSGYALYAPATLLIKGLMALIAYAVINSFKGDKKFLPRALGALLAALWMVIGYYVFEGFLYGFGASLVNVPANAIQGAVGAAFGVLLVQLIQKVSPGIGKQE
ncbi:MAG: ECF transporter S component [Ruminococcaceae bacterium]|nr:ECF transporter S component [Oscillospiraceae bacterium]